MTEFSVDVVLRTYNRGWLIEGAIDSILAADRSGIALHVYVIDNASTDNTPQIVAGFAAQHPGLIIPLHESKPGGQIALNTAIAACNSPVIAFFDDDERVDPNWLQVIKREFSDPAIDFIAGLSRPILDGPLPDWLPTDYGGVLGIIDNGPVRARFDRQFRGMLTQGNCAVRRPLFAEAGPYPIQLKTAEDRWFYTWLIANGKNGYYCPDLIINHTMQQDRLTKAYFRKWAVREGRDRAQCDQLAGTPSVLRTGWFWRARAADAAQLAGAFVTGTPGSSKGFTAELNLRQAWQYFRRSVGGR